MERFGNEEEEEQEQEQEEEEEEEEFRRSTSRKDDNTYLPPPPLAPTSATTTTITTTTVGVLVPPLQAVSPADIASFTPLDLALRSHPEMAKEGASVLNARAIARLVDGIRHFQSIHLGLVRTLDVFKFFLLYIIYFGFFFLPSYTRAMSILYLSYYFTSPFPHRYHKYY